jgi:hypothetical protein
MDVAEEFSVTAILLRLQGEVKEQGVAIVTMSEQTAGIREDIARMDKTLSDATRVMGELHTEYLTRDESDKITTTRDEERDKTAKEIKAIWKRVDGLTGWRNWLTGVLMALVAIGYTAFDYLHQWLVGIGGGKP